MVALQGQAAVVDCGVAATNDLQIPNTSHKRINKRTLQQILNCSRAVEVVALEAQAAVVDSGVAAADDLHVQQHQKDTTLWGWHRGWHNAAGRLK